MRYRVHWRLIDAKDVEAESEQDARDKFWDDIEDFYVNPNFENLEIDWTEELDEYPDIRRL